MLQYKIAASVTACEAERAPAGITCDKLRALRIGMSIDEVRALLGPPYNEIRQTGNVVFGGPEGTDMSWNWMEYSNGVRLYVSFGNGRLLGVDSSERCGVISLTTRVGQCCFD
jgi:hypothetical protein